MKKVAMVLGVVLVLLAGAGYYVFSNLDALVQRAIETAGSSAIGTQVSVDAVSIDLGAGTAVISGFAVANPQGFSAGELLAFDELTVALDTARISSTEIGIRAITARNPRVFYESRDGRSNFDAVTERFPASSNNAEVDAPAGEPLRLVINLVDIDGISGALSAPVLPQPLQVQLGDIELRDMNGTPSEIARQVLRPLLTQISRNAGSALLSATAAQLGENAEALGQQALDQAGERVEQATEALQESGDRLREGFGNLLNRGGEQE